MKAMRLMSFFVLTPGMLGCGPGFSSEAAAETESGSGTDPGSGESSGDAKTMAGTSNGGQDSEVGSTADATSSAGGSVGSETTGGGADDTASSNGRDPTESMSSTGNTEGSSSGSGSAGSTGSTGGTGGIGGSSTGAGASGGSGPSILLEECGGFGSVALLDLDTGRETWVVELDVASMGGVSGVSAELHVVAPSFPFPTTFADTTITLRHGGDAVLLYDNLCPSATEIDLLFEDGGASLDCSDIAGGVVVEPVGSLATFAGAGAGGSWRLELERPASLGGAPSAVVACVSVAVD